MNWYVAVLQKYSIFTGRARRKEYWYFTVINVVISVLLGFIDGIFGSFNHEFGVGLLSGLYSLAILIPAIAVSVRRLHDTGKSGWWLLVVFVPVLGFLVMLILMALPGQAQQNEYGSSPKTSAG